MKCRVFSAIVLIFLAVGVSRSQASAAQEVSSLHALEALIAEIRERFLGEAPQPDVGTSLCDMEPEQLVAQYIDTFRLFRDYDAEMKEVVAIEWSANEAIRKGDFCNAKIVREQERGIEMAQYLDLDSVLVSSKEIAQCAPVLRQNAELQLASVRSPAQLAQIQQTIDRMRDMHGDALAIASQMAYARDLRSRVVEMMEGNVSVCR